MSWGKPIWLQGGGVGGRLGCWHFLRVPFTYPAFTIWKLGNPFYGGRVHWQVGLQASNRLGAWLAGRRKIHRTVSSVIIGT